MREKLHFWNTLFFVILSFFFNFPVLNKSLPFLIILCICGWFFSWYIKGRKIEGINYMIDIVAVVIVIFMVYSIFNSSFSYKEIVAIFIKGLAAFIVLLSFGVYFYRFLSFAQFLSFQLFLFSYLFISEKRLTPLVFFYLLVGVIMIITRSCKMERTEVLSKNLSVAIILFTLSFFIAKTSIIRTPKKNEVEFFNFLPLKSEKFSEEERYYYLLDKLSQIVKAPSLKNYQEESYNLFLLTQLAKEPPSFLEVLNAYLGLVDYLKRKGPGLKGESESIVILREFTRSKAKRRIKEVTRKIIDDSKSLSLMKKMELLKGTIVMLNSRNIRKIERVKEYTKRKIKEDKKEDKKKKEIAELLDELEEWRILEIYLRRIEELKEMLKGEKNGFREKIFSFVKDIENIKSEEEIEGINNELKILEGYRDFNKKKEIIEKVKDLTNAYLRLVKKNKLEKDKEQREEKALSFQIIPSSVEIMKGEKKKIKAIVNFSTYSKDVTSSVDWVSLNNGIVQVENGWLKGISEGEALVYAYFLGKKSNFCKVKVISPTVKYLVLSVDKPKIKMGEAVRLKAKAYYSEFIFKDVTSVVKFYINNPKIIRRRKNIIEGIKWGRTSIYCEYRGVKSPAIEIEVFPSLAYLIKIIVSILLLSFVLFFLHFFSCQKIKHLQLKKKMQISSQEFVIELYDNLRKVLEIFGFSYVNQPLLEYATFVEKETGIRNIFLKITNKFMEANYSSRKIKSEEVATFVENYNNFLRELARRYNLITFLKKYCLILLRRCIFFF